MPGKLRDLRKISHGMLMAINCSPRERSRAGTASQKYIPTESCLLFFLKTNKNEGNCSKGNCYSNSHSSLIYKDRYVLFLSLKTQQKGLYKIRKLTAGLFIFLVRTVDYVVTSTTTFDAFLVVATKIVSSTGFC